MKTAGFATAIVLAAGSLSTLAQQPLRAHIYPDAAAAPGDIAGALAEAKREHKRVLLDFGGDCCSDCQVLNLYFHEPENLSLLNKHYVLVDVNVGRMDLNTDLAAKYGVDLKKGVPALSVLTAKGKVVFAQKNGEFEKMRTMDPGSVETFLKQWK